MRYSTSALGYFWSILDPLVMAGIYWFVFTQVFDRSVGDTPYIVFLLAALLPWMWFNGAVSDCTRAFLREAIELAAIERVSTDITPEQLTQLRRNLTVQQVLVADNDFAGFYKLDSEMHELLLSFSGYRKLSVVSETASAHVNRARRLLLPIPGRALATLAEHRAILAALEARDPNAARHAVRHHLRQLLTLVEPLERSHPDLFHP